MNQQTVYTIDNLKHLVVSSALSLGGALAILVIGWIIAGLVQRWTRRLLERTPHMDATLTPFIAGTTRYVILAFVIVAVLAQFGVQTTSIIAALGAVGLGVGLALQGTLSHIAAGIMLLALRPFRINEYIDADGISGTVVEIGLFATELRTFDGVFQHVPNGTLLSRSIKNYSRNPTRRIDIQVGISYGDDVDKALAVAKSVLDADSRLLADPPAETMVLALADSSVNINLRCWVKAGDYWGALFGLTKAIKQRLDAEGISIPFPQRDLHIVEDKTK